LVGIACDSEPDAPPADDTLVLPAIEYCDGVREWNEPDAALEREILERVNALRAEGVECEGIARFPASEPLRLSGRATCAARIHADDMRTNGFVDHAGSDGSTPWDRLRDAGSTFAVADQVIAAGAIDPTAVVDEIWMTRPGSCAALMAPEYSYLGIGWASGDDETSHEHYVVGMAFRSRASAPR
jgi:uncharacterized protein YkwD